MPDPNIVVNNNNSGPNFNPETHPVSGNVPAGGSVSFRATGSDPITFYAYQGTGSAAQWAFAGVADNGECNAPRSSSDPQTYTLKQGVTGPVTLSTRNPRARAKPRQGTNGQINVGGGDPA